MKHCQRHGPEKDPYCVDCWKDERERDAICPSDSTACSASSELIENLGEWGEHFREKQHGATLTILRARKTILDQTARIDALEEILNRLFHYTDCTTGQMDESAKIIFRLMKYADRTAENHPEAVTSLGQNARARAGFWLAQYERENAERLKLCLPNTHAHPPEAG